MVVDVSGDGLDLTGAAGGVAFDLDSDGTAERLSWTEAGTDDAWLALDGGVKRRSAFSPPPRARRSSVSF